MLRRTALVLAILETLAWAQTHGTDAPQRERLLSEAAVLDAERTRQWNEGNYDQAVRLTERMLKLREQALGPKHPDVATALRSLAVAYHLIGDDERAEPLMRRSLALRQELFGPRHPKVGDALYILGTILRVMGKKQEARRLLEEALALQEEALGPRDPAIAQNLLQLAIAVSPDDEAVPLYERTIAIGEERLGRQHPWVAIYLHALAEHQLAHGQYTKAEPLYERAIAITEQALGPRHPRVALFLGDLASLYLQIGEYARAEQLLLRAVGIQQEHLPPENPEATHCRAFLASLYLATGQWAKAKPILELNLALREKQHGPRHPYLIAPLVKLAALDVETGQYAQAEPLLQRAITIMMAESPDRPDIGKPLGYLGTLHLALGDEAQAERDFERALQAEEARFGPRHPEVANALNNLALLRASQGSVEAALTYFERAAAVSETSLYQHLSESQIASHLGTLRAAQDQIYSLLAEHPAHPGAQRLALSVALLRKGRALETGAAATRAILRSLRTPEDREHFARLNGLRSQLAHLYLEEPAPEPKPGLKPEPAKQDPHARIEALAQEIDHLTRQLTRASAVFNTLSPPGPDQIVHEVARRLPRNGVLAEIVAFRPYRFHARGHEPRWGPRRYLGLVLRGDERIAAVDLGEAVELDVRVHQLVALLRRRDSEYLPVAQRAYRQIMAPLRAHAQEARQWLLSLDGELQLLPFAALHDGRRHLIDDTEFLYLTSGRDLLRGEDQDVPSGPVTLLADPALSAWPAGAPPRTTAERGVIPARQRDLLSLLRDVSPLPGAREEAKAIGRRFPGARLLLGDAATEEALLSVTAPRILHVATHGLVMNDDGPALPGSRDADRGLQSLGASAGPPPLPRDPMSRSVLVMAGAAELAEHPLQLPDGEQRDGLVSALEVQGMNLWGTRLVVLSACNSGVGDTHHVGQGVYGLRRAFLLAGAETLVTSLWPVEDRGTGELMVAYYENLRAGKGRSEALRLAALAMRKRRAHPYYWAPFIVIGRGTAMTAG
ncbi:MAG TPA: CHAT domain-containing tetratricopeptide repeat protein [Polyangia bacterium]|nr:CHAT domain-containing tetratricopeptide repeat protein [Polyangia bacterium]